MIATTRSAISVSAPTMFVAFELGKKEWTLAVTSGIGVTPVLRTVPAREWPRVLRVLSEARQRLGLAATAGVVSCYEAGRDGFWIHRALWQQGIANRVVDSASIEVSRRARQAKTDRLDARKLVEMLVRVCYGEQRVWREVRVPTEAEEAARHVSRERSALIAERTALMNQLQSWLTLYGCGWPAHRGATWWREVRTWNASELPAAVQARIARAAARVALLATQLDELETQQASAAQAAPPTAPLRRLSRLKGIGVTGAAIVLDEGLVWRDFQNRRQIGGFLGFAPTPFQSGEMHREQGISRAGNARLQAISIELAWSWVRWQPASTLTQWYQHRFGRGKRARRIGIVALARKLVIALWRYLTTGTVPTGAVLKAA